MLNLLVSVFVFVGLPSAALAEPAQNFEINCHSEERVNDVGLHIYRIYLTIGDNKCSLIEKSRHAFYQTFFDIQFRCELSAAANDEKYPIYNLILVNAMPTNAEEGERLTLLYSPTNMRANGFAHLHSHQAYAVNCRVQTLKK